MASTQYLNEYLNDETSTLQASKSGFFAHGGRHSPAPPIPGYDQYIAMGPGGLTEDNTPLLYSSGSGSRLNLAPIESGTSATSYNSHQVQQPVYPDMQYPPSGLPVTGYPGQVSRPYSPAQGNNSPRPYVPSQASGLARPYSPSQRPGTRPYTPQNPYNQQQGSYPPQHTRDMSHESINMAGRGAGSYRRWLLVSYICILLDISTLQDLCTRIKIRYITLVPVWTLLLDFGLVYFNTHTYFWFRGSK